MYIRILLNYILGYVNIRIEGYFVEKFVNICISKGIFLWNIKRVKQATAYANIGIKDFKRINKIAKNTKCKISIQSKRGLPFLFNKYRKRKAFAVLLILVIIFIIGLSNFVWNIEVTGNTTISKEEILKSLEENGLKIGIFKNKIDTKQVVNNIRLKRNDLAWIGIKLEGTNAIVKIVEADKKPEIINEEEYCNIVATKERNNSKSKRAKWDTLSKRR